MIDAEFLRQLATCIKNAGVQVEAFSIYIPPSRNQELDDILREAVCQASHGYFALSSSFHIEENTKEELTRRGFTLESVIGDRYMLQW